MIKKYYYNKELEMLILAEFFEDGELDNVIEFDGAVEMVSDEEEEEEIEIVPKKRKDGCAARGMKTDYNLADVIKDIKSGMKTKDIADKHKVSTQTIYNIKSTAKKEGILDDKKEPQKKGVFTCGNCGKEGHTRASCSEEVGSEEEPVEGSVAGSEERADERSKHIKSLLVRGITVGETARLSESSEKVVLFVRRQMISRGELEEYL